MPLQDRGAELEWYRIRWQQDKVSVHLISKYGTVRNDVLYPYLPIVFIHIQYNEETASSSPLPLPPSVSNGMTYNQQFGCVHSFFIYKNVFSLVRGASRPSSCQLSICALINLSHEMQSGGDERAGRATTDPHGIGKR